MPFDEHQFKGEFSAQITNLSDELLVTKPIKLSNNQ